MNNILTGLLEGDVVTIFFKIVLLLCIGLFVVFTLFLFNYVNSLQRIVIIKDITGSAFINLVAITLILASVSLFFLALVIL